MAINIKNQEAERLLNRLSKKRRLGKSQLVLELLRREADRQARLSDFDRRKRQIDLISQRYVRRAGRHAPSHEEIIGYDERGLPT